MANEHHPFPPSSLDKIAICPHYKSGESGEYADYGTLVHAVASGQAPASSLDEEGRKMVEYWHNIIPIGGKTNFKLTLIDEGFETITFGTPDYLMVTEDHIAIYDLKTGDEHDYSLQMMAYAIAARRLMRLPVYATVVFARHRTTQQYEYGGDLDFYITQLRTLIKHAMTAGSGDYNPSPDACQYCGKKNTCPALCGLVKYAGEKYEPKLELANWHPSEISDPAQMAYALNLAKVIGKWSDSVEHHAKKMALSGQQIPGWYLKPRQGNIEITDAQKAFELSGLDNDKFLDCVKVSISELSKKIAERDGISNLKARKQVEEQLADIISRGDTINILTKEKA